jgi:TonB family protein
MIMRHPLIWILAVAQLLFACGITRSAVRYQQLSDKVASVVPQGIMDSILIVWGPPVGVLPDAAVKAGLNPIVWVRVAVGAKGRATDAQVIKCDNPGYGLERAAVEAAMNGLYYAFWDGPYPVEYTGYYPVQSFGRFDDPGPDVLLELPFLLDKTVSGTLRFVPDRVLFSKPLDWKEREVGVGRDAPIVISRIPIDAPRPREELSRERTEWVWLEIGRDGRPRDAKPLASVVNPRGTASKYSKQVAKAAKAGLYPIKMRKNSPCAYEAYTAVTVRPDSTFYLSRGLPLPRSEAKVDVEPKPLYERSITLSGLTNETGIQGDVRLSILIDTTGEVISAVIDSANDFPELNALAIPYSQGVRYSPAKLNGQSVSAWTTWRARFVRKTSGSESPLVAQKSDSRLEVGVPNTNARDSSEHPTPGEFVAIDKPPEMIKEARATYPRLALLEGVEGTVWVWAVVDKNGYVREAKIVKSSGSKSLDDAALAAARQCEYKPAIQKGKPISCPVTYPVRFIQKGK